MALHAVSITKDMTYRGIREEFANTYVYDIPTVSEANFASLVNSIHDAEAQIHATSVNFIRARVWSTGGLPSENETVYMEEFADAGQAVPEPLWYRPACFLISWRTGRKNSLDKPVHLHKYYHSLSALGAADNSFLNGAAEIPVATTLDMLNQITSTLPSISLIDGTTALLSSPGGREPLNATPAIYKYLTFHDLHY